MARKAPPPPPLPEWDAAPAYTIAKGEFAKDMEVTPAAVSQWVAKGMPVRDDGRLDTAVVAKWLLDNLDPVNGHRTRFEALGWQRFCAGLASERLHVRKTVEAAAAAAYEAALAAGLAPEAAATLADGCAAGAVERMNPWLVGESNLALPVPPPDVWRRHVAARTEEPCWA